jgi:hypothetical protein
MSSHRIDVPAPDQLDYHADLACQRRRLALAKIHPEDLLAAVMAELAERPLPEHPLQHLILWLLDRQLTPGHGGELFDGLKQAVSTQVERLLDAVLADPAAWEVD